MATKTANSQPEWPTVDGCEHTRSPLQASDQARIWTKATLIAVATLAALGCAEAAPDPDADEVEVACTLGTVDPTDPTSFRALADGDEIEITRGYQGYLLVLLQLQTANTIGRRTKVEIATSRDEGPVRESIIPALDWEPRPTGGTRSDVFEAWLTPALVKEFAGRSGWIRIRAASNGGVVRCAVERKVRFVDRNICMHHDDGTLDCSANATDTVDPNLGGPDGAPLKHLLALRALSQAAASAPWPAQAPWPGYALHTLPIYQVVRDTKGKLLRGYLVGVDSAPAGGKALIAAGLSGVQRYDAGLNALWDGIDGATAVDVAGSQVMVIGVGPGQGGADDDAYALRVAALAMARLHEVDAPWRMVQVCGQANYPRVVQAIALLHLECAVLDEALVATDPANRRARLHEWAAIRAAANDTSSLIGLRFRHFDNTFAAEQFAARRLVAVDLPGAETLIVQGHRAALAVPTTVAIEGFDDAMWENGNVGAAALEVAARLGLDPVPVYEKAGTVQMTVTEAFGPAPEDAVTNAQGRHDWQAILKRAAAIAALPEAGPGFEP